LAVVVPSTFSHLFVGKKDVREGDTETLLFVLEQHPDDDA